MIVDNSRGGCGGTIFVQQATVAQEPPANPQDPSFQAPDAVYERSRVADAAADDACDRALQPPGPDDPAGRKAQDDGRPVDASIIDGDAMVYNTDRRDPRHRPKLKDEIVMLGGHMDSWHAGTGATDNGAGVAVAMEAVRILKALGPQAAPDDPRRALDRRGTRAARLARLRHTALRRDEGRPEPTSARRTRTRRKPRARQGQPITTSSRPISTSTTAPARSAASTCRATRPSGRSSASGSQPFRDMGANDADDRPTPAAPTTFRSTRIGLPGFQFIQDEIEYDTPTHHSNQDVFDRIQADDMKQAATIMAAFVYHTAMMDEKMPRKAVNLDSAAKLGSSCSFVSFSGSSPKIENLEAQNA